MFALLLATSCGGQPEHGKTVITATPADATILEASPGAAFRIAAAGEAIDPSHAVLMDMRVDARAKTPDQDADATRLAAAAAGANARVISRVDGKFGGDIETVLLVEGGDGRRWLVPVADDTAVARIASDGASALLSSPDTNLNDENEVLVRYDNERNGVTHVDLELLAFPDGAATRVTRFRDARVDACATSKPSVRALRIGYGPTPPAGAWPEFVAIASHSECVDGRAPDFAGYLRAERPAK